MKYYDRVCRRLVSIIRRRAARQYAQHHRVSRRNNAARAGPPDNAYQPGRGLMENVVINASTRRRNNMGGG